MAEVPAAPRWVRPAARWIIPNPSHDSVRHIQQALNLHRLPAAVLVNRGFHEARRAQEFLSPELETLHDPFLLRDMDRAVDRLQQAIGRHENILLYGDYDVDGTASIVILKKTIELLGGAAEFHIPHRLKDGYGMRAEVIERAAAMGIRLIVSVDTGIRAKTVVAHARELGIDVIVTDHHLPEAELPACIAVLNPNRPDCPYPNKHLCGAGVTFKLVHALLQRSGMTANRQAALLDSFLKPVAIATIADVVPLVDENRVLARRGLGGLRKVRNIGLRALLAVAGFEEGECPTAHQVAFRIAPRINAAGRMATAHDVVEIFLTDDAARARELAENLDVLNRERQQTETEIIDAILKQCEEIEFDYDARAMVFAGSGWHLGVLGIVASRLVERFSRPVFVVSDAAAEANTQEHYLSGSGRSISGFHLLEALESMPELFQKFGGHRQAAGVTLRADQLDSFRKRFVGCAGERLTHDDLRPQFAADAEAAFTELTDSCVQQVMSLGPFGFGNAAPLFLSRECEVAAPAKALKDGKHFSVPLRNSGRLLFCKAWNFGDRTEYFAPGTKLDVLFHLEDDASGRKRGYGSWCVSIKDVRRC
jgi:single-stranded-DNA-specific exonuclease